MFFLVSSSRSNITSGGLSCHGGSGRGCACMVLVGSGSIRCRLGASRMPSGGCFLGRF